MKLMVYGTLKKGYGNNILLQGAKYLGEAVTKKHYVLLNCGFPKATTLTVDEQDYPMLPVMGEVYEVDERHIRSCDSLEGHPDWYRRETIKATFLQSGEEDDVMIYEMPEWTSGRKKCNVVNGAYVWER